MLTCDHRSADASAPNPQLLDGCRAERVAGPEGDALALVDQLGGELGDRRRLARPVHTDDEDDERPVTPLDAKRYRHPRQHPLDFARQDRLYLAGVDPLFVARRGHGGGDPGCHGEPKIGSDQHVLQVFEGRGVELPLVEDIDDALLDGR